MIHSNSLRRVFLLGFTLFVALFSLAGFAFAAGPTGAATTYLNSSSFNPAEPTSQPAIAGNITEIGVNGLSSTRSWQGYYGNASGTIQLADSANYVFYNWSVASPSGEIYASTNQSIIWTTLQCFNYTANGTQQGTGGETAGNVNLGGLNLTGLETRFGINSSDYDGVNETFTFSGVGGHDLFYTGSLDFTEGECMSTRVYSASGPVANQYEEALLYEPASTSVVFASLLEEFALSGYNTANNDFEMLVLEDGHGTDTASTLYYFFVELE